MLKEDETSRESRASPSHHAECALGYHHNTSDRGAEHHLEAAGSS